MLPPSSHYAHSAVVERIHLKATLLPGFPQHPAQHTIERRPLDEGPKVQTLDHALEFGDEPVQRAAPAAVGIQDEGPHVVRADHLEPRLHGREFEVRGFSADARPCSDSSVIPVAGHAMLPSVFARKGGSGGGGGVLWEEEKEENMFREGEEDAAVATAPQVAVRFSRSWSTESGACCSAMADTMRV
ncbi:hypothetical protein PG990_004520 [Apiospora arundinis]